MKAKPKTEHQPTRERLAGLPPSHADQTAYVASWFAPPLPMGQLDLFPREVAR